MRYSSHKYVYSENRSNMSTNDIMTRVKILYNDNSTHYLFLFWMTHDSIMFCIPSMYQVAHSLKFSHPSFLSEVIYQPSRCS